MLKTQISFLIFKQSFFYQSRKTHHHRLLTQHDDTKVGDVINNFMPPTLIGKSFIKHKQRRKGRDIR